MWKEKDYHLPFSFISRSATAFDSRIVHSPHHSTDEIEDEKVLPDIYLKH